MVGRVAVNERDAMRQLTVAQATADTARDEAAAARQRAEEARVAAQEALEAAERDAEAAADEVAALAVALAVAEEEREKAEAELARIEDEPREWEEANLDGARSWPPVSCGCRSMGSRPATTAWGSTRSPGWSGCTREWTSPRRAVSRSRRPPPER
jgi:hypothetical protein